MPTARALAALATLLFAGAPACGSASAGGPSPAALALARGDLDAALRLPSGDAQEAAYIDARVALARGRVAEATAGLGRLHPESHRAAELAWLVAHARRDAAAIGAAARRFCARRDPSGRACVDAELYTRPLPPQQVTLAADGEVELIEGAPFPVVLGDVGNARTGIVIDTGASQTVISRRLADHLGIPTSSSGFPIGVAAGSGSTMAHLGVLPELRIGPAVVRNLPVLVVDLADLEDKYIAAIVSPQQAFDGLVVTFDFARHRLELSRRVDPAVAEGAEALPYFMVGFDMAVRASVGSNPPGLFVLDTGMANSFAVARNYVGGGGDGAALGAATTTVHGAGAQREVPMVGARPIRLGNLTLRPDSPGLLTDLVRSDGIQIAGLLGNRLWPRGRLTLDTPGRRVLLRLQ